jgi:acyl-[acyl-carrier-protein]-phospholipid O-acyltransferase/long-chain-fatty-acid--[acyl-carrier-protein] ligase
MGLAVIFRRILYLFGRLILKILYRVEVRGMENYRAAGKRVLVLPNHTSLLDAALVALFMPDLPVFAINLFVAENWGWLKPFLSLIRTWPVDPTSPFALKGLIAEMKRDGFCVVFPEGRITTTGGIMRIYDGAAMLADKTGAALLPLRIDGALFSKASYMKGKYPLRLFPKITMTFLPPRAIEVPHDIKGRRRREMVGIFLHDLMRDSAYLTMNHGKTLFQALLDARKLYGKKHPIAVDAGRKSVCYDKFITAALVLGDKLSGLTERGGYTGVLLPGSIPTVAAVLGLSRNGRIPAMLNYTAGVKNILSCCSAAQIKTVVTSRKFVEAGKFSFIIAAMESAGIKVIWLEDVSKSITKLDKLAGYMRARFTGIGNTATDPDSPALALFTSGSEGTPKGVVLSHRNIIANRDQLISSIDFNPSDIVMNAMPMFHVFGFVVGTLMPLFTGVKTFYYPTPLHYRVIPIVAYDINATVLFGTDTFLFAYARSAHPYDFYRVRYAFAGAEKLRDRTRALWGEKFGIRVIEGYGTTETSIISANTALNFRMGTVGRLMPGMKYRLEEIPGVTSGGRLFVSGENVMKGYLRADAPGAIQPPANGWYDTGDIVEVDQSGFVTIKGRVKRFAKIGGEMISLTAIEEEIERLWSGVRHAVVAANDERKGEQLVLVTETRDPKKDDLAAFLRASGYTEVSIPKKIISVETLPLLGSGKTDYPAVLAELGLLQ